MNRAAYGERYPLQVISRFVINRPREVFYIGGNDILPAPLTPEKEGEAIGKLGTEENLSTSIGTATNFCCQIFWGQMTM